MDKTTAQVVALSRFLDISSVRESWHANRFPRLVQTVKDELIEKHDIDYHMGLEIDWAQWRPGHVSVSIHGVAVSGQKFFQQWPLTGTVGAALLDDFKALASDKAVQDIERERIEQLRREADQRVAGLLSTAKGFAEESTPEQDLSH